jgi:hypothetical protein
MDDKPHKNMTFPAALDPVQAATLFVAICALVVTVWQGVVTRKHNRLSVTPVLTLYRRENDGIITVKNNGTGPALIVSQEVYFKGEPVDENSFQKAIPHFVDSGHLLPGAAIAPGDEVLLFKSATYLDGSHIDILKELRFRITYESIYKVRRVLE